MLEDIVVPSNRPIGNDALHLLVIVVSGVLSPSRVEGAFNVLSLSVIDIHWYVVFIITFVLE